MSPSERDTPGARGSRWVWFAGLALVFVFVVVAAHDIGRANGAMGIAQGQPIPPFTVPLALSAIDKDADVATHNGDGAAGAVAACSLQLADALNVCDSYARVPLVLALFVDRGSCPDILTKLQSLRTAFPLVGVAAVAIRGNRDALRSTIRHDGLTFPVGYDRDGILADLYRVSSCPQVSFILPGGVVAEPSLLANVTTASLDARVTGLLASARARGWHPPPSSS